MTSESKKNEKVEQTQNFGNTSREGKKRQGKADGIPHKDSMWIIRKGGRGKNSAALGETRNSEFQEVG